MIRAILNGSLANIETRPDPVFGVGVPTSCPGVPADVLTPRNTWADAEAYDRKAKELARRFNDNFKKYESGVSAAVRAVAPKAD
jgi:phosphoenolpyruvate carboxykinase (ATP)